MAPLAMPPLTTALSIQVSWWCSGAAGRPWEWVYTPFVGVWVIAAIMLAIRYGLIRILTPLPSSGYPARQPDGTTLAKPRDTRADQVRYLIGVLAFVGVSEWPLGQLGAGYLLSIAVVRFMIYLMLVSPNLIRGIPAWVWESLLCSNRHVETIMRQITRWPAALMVSSGYFLLTMYPPFVDMVKVYQLGSFLMDMGWLAAMMIFWWPILGPVDQLPRLRDPWQSLYIFGLNMIMLIPVIYFVYAPLPVFVLYELAPPVFLGYDVLMDQRGGGIIMKLIMMCTLWPLMATFFLRWAYRHERFDAGTATEQDFAYEARAAAHQAIHTTLSDTQRPTM